MARPKQAKNEKPKRPTPFTDNEIIEISSGSEDEGTQTGVLINSLRERIEQLKEENERQQRDLEKYELNFSKGKVTLDVAIVEENLNCEICTGRMWSPYLLPDCGHTFCQSCLQDWFNTTLTKFTAEHPNTNWQQRSHLRPILMNPMLMNNPEIVRAIPLLNATMPRYSCPTCRKAVHARPAEVYALKALVRSFASVVGEKSPQKESRARGGRKTSADPWDHFFLPQDMA